MFNSFYGLSFNPFDKQQMKEKDHFISKDFTEMTNRLNYLKDIRAIGVFTARPGMEKSFCLRCFAAGLNPSLFHIRYQSFPFLASGNPSPNFWYIICTIRDTS